MDQGYKHFSHLHNLIMHEMPEGAEVSCFGCHSSATGTVYVCWQCNFFLHDQCYRATRSLKHPSHPSHPLTLVPYPTYPSNSFYCNSCHIVGTGFSYSCADCEFDLHVQCAYSISRATSFKNSHRFHELVPQGWNGIQNSGIDHHVPFNGAQNHFVPQNSVSRHDLPSVSVPMSSQNPLPNAQYPPMNRTEPSVSIPVNYPPNLFPSSHDPAMTQDQPSVSIPTSSQNRISSAQYPSITQTGPAASIPTNFPPNTVPIRHESHDPSMPQDGSSVSIPTGSRDRISSVQYPSITQTEPSIRTDYPHNPIPSAQDPLTSQNRPISVPTSSYNPSAHYPSAAQTGSDSDRTGYPQNPIPSAQGPSMPQNKPESITTSSHNSSAQYPSVAQTGPSVSIPTNPSDPITSSHDQTMSQNGFKNKEVMHFSHPHKLSKVNIQEDEENEVVCSGCEDTLVGNGYSCVEPECEFHLHESCYHLKKEIHHRSHLEHPLTLLPLAPYENKDGEFTCNACFSGGTGFTYHCSICKFDLHVTCVNLPETVKRADHKHTLKLFYSCPMKDEDFYCDVCHGEVQKDRWVYYCEPCDYGTHLGCVDCEECERDSILDTQAQLQRLQLQMQMARQNAQFMASMGSSLASLVG